MKNSYFSHFLSSICIFTAQALKKQQCFDNKLMFLDVWKMSCFKNAMIIKSHLIALQHYQATLMETSPSPSNPI